LERGPVDPTRVSGKRLSILSKLNAVNITDEIRRDIEAAKVWLEKNAELIAASYPPEPPVELPPTPTPPVRVNNHSEHRTLKR
jgi:hypothetical protein